MATKITKSPSSMSDERLVDVGLLRRLLRLPEVGAIVGALAVGLFFSLIDPTNFASIRGVSRILDPASTLGIMAVAVGLLMIGGEFDLSTGAMTGSTGLIMGMLAVEAGWSVWTAMLASLAFALTVGYINGLLVMRTRLPSFIITLATFFILRGANVGVTEIVTGEVRVQGIDEAPGFIAARALFNIEFDLFGISFRSTIIWWVLITILATWVLTRTKFGSWIFAVGGDAPSARNVGVPVERVKISLFMITASAAWLVGIMNALRLRSALSSQGIGQEFIFIIAAVIGGCQLTGGYGSAVGAAIGALVFGMTRVGITFAGWNTDWFFAFLGVVLLVSVVLNNVTRRRAEKITTAMAKSAPVVRKGDT